MTISMRNYSKSLWKRIIARLSGNVSYCTYQKVHAAGSFIFKNVKPGLGSLIDRMHFDQVPHYWCGGSFKAWLPEFDDYVQCVKCGCKSVRFRLTWESTKDFYTNQYWYDYQKIHDCPSIEKRYETDMVDRIPSYLAWISQLCPAPAKIMEVGCGNGRLAYELAKTDYIVSATEMDPVVAQWVTEKTGIHVFVGDFPPIDHSPYDMIIIIDVLEHVHDPEKFVHEVKLRLRESGQVFLHCPVIDTVNEARSSKHLYNPLSHIWMHSTTSIMQLWQSVGLKPKRIGKIFSMPCFVLTRVNAASS